MAPRHPSDYQPLLTSLHGDSRPRGGTVRPAALHAHTIRIKSLLHFVATIFAIIAIPCLIIGSYDDIVAFPLVFLFFSVFTHGLKGLSGCAPCVLDIQYTSGLLRIEWKRREVRLQPKKIKGGLGVWVSRLWNFLLFSMILVGTALTCAFGFHQYGWGYNPNPNEGIAGAVFAFLTATIHLVLILPFADRRLISITFEKAEETELVERAASPEEFLYIDADEEQTRRPSTEKDDSAV